MHRTYENDDLAVFWDSDKCFHAKRCRGKSSEIFDPGRRPWIDLSKGTSAEIWEAVTSCPSGALTCTYKHEIVVKMDEDNNRSIACDNERTVGECTFSVRSGKLYIEHTLVDENYRGKDIAKRLVFAVAEYSERNSFETVPLCSYAVKQLGEA